MSTNDQDEAVKEVHEHAAKVDLKRHQVTLGGKAEDYGYIATNAENETSTTKLKNKKNKNWKFEDLVRHFLDDMRSWTPAQHIQKFDEFAKWMNEKADEFETQALQVQTNIEANIEKMQANATFISQADTLIEAHRKGRPIDPQKVKELLKPQNIEVNDSLSHTLLIQQLEETRHQANNENASLDLENQTHEDSIESLINQAEEYRNMANHIHEQTTQIEDDINNGVITEEQAKEKLQGLWKDVPKQVLSEYEKAYSVSEHTAERSHEIDQETNSKLMSQKGEYSKEFNIVSEGIADAPSQDQTFIKTNDFNPLGLG